MIGEPEPLSMQATAPHECRYDDGKCYICGATPLPAKEETPLLGEMIAQAMLGHKRFCIGAHEHEGSELEYEWIEWTQAFARLLKSAPALEPASDRSRSNPRDSAVLALPEELRDA